MKFKVIGQKAQTFYVNVEAKTPAEAYDIANSSDTIKWTEIKTDDVIEPTEVLEIVNVN